MTLSPAVTSPDSTGIPSVDNAALDELRSLVGDALLDIVDAFITDGERLLTELREGVSASDAALVRANAHQLKSSSASLGAHKFSAYMQEMESIGAEGTVDGAQAILDAALTDFEHVRTHLLEAAS